MQVEHVEGKSCLLWPVALICQLGPNTIPQLSPGLSQAQMKTQHQSQTQYQIQTQHQIQNQNQIQTQHQMQNLHQIQTH